MDEGQGNGRGRGATARGRGGGEGPDWEAVGGGEGRRGMRWRNEAGNSHADPAREHGGECSDTEGNCCEEPISSRLIRKEGMVRSLALSKGRNPRWVGGRGGTPDG